ncbi:MAG: HTH-type transcriptional regulator MalT [Anaerolineae bacterium]|nr:HTH-type transcriptional regulator MalT [Anaerolineae bacterium]
MSFSILATKLFVPPPRAELVPRPRLLNRLTASFQRKPGVALVSAPAGFGKTTLVSSWINQKDEGGRIKDEKSEIHPSSPILHPSNVAWLSLDEGDNDQLRFFTYLVAALQQANPQVGQVIQSMLRAEPPQLPSPDALATTLINDIAAAATPLVLVLDDYHVIDNPLIDQTLNFLIDHQPPQLFLVLTSRIDPDLPLARLRVRGKLTELRAADLRFTADEAAAFLKRVTNLPLTKQEIIALESRTEGWIAGLQLAALSMQGSSDVAGFISAFTGSHRYIIDYLADEVLDRQPPSIRSFLLRTAILNRLSAPLCNAVTGQTGSQAMLEQVESANLFLIALDNERRWYRYHHLFADLLRQRLHAETPPTEIAGLHGRAALWYGQQAEATKQPEVVTEALHHTLKAGDSDFAVRLISAHVADNLMGGRLTTVSYWLDQLSPALVQSHPTLSIARAWVLYFSQQPELTETYLQHAAAQAEQQKESLPPRAYNWIMSEVYLLRAWVAQNQNNPDRAIELFQKSLAILPGNDPNSLRTRGLNLLFMAGALADKDEIEKAIELVKQSLAICREAGNYLALMGGAYALASLLTVQGHLQQARAVLEQELAWAAGQNLLHMPSAAELFVGLGEILYEENQLEPACEHWQTALELSARGLMITPLPGAIHLHLAALHLAQADQAATRAHLEQAEELLRDQPPSASSFELDTRRVRLWLGLAWANPAAAEQWLAPASDWLEQTRSASHPDSAHNRAIGQAVAARLLVAQAGLGLSIDTPALAAVGQSLKKLGQAAVAAGRMGRLTELLALQALVLAAQGSHAEALAALKQSLTLAEPEGYARLYLDEGPPMAALLQKALQQNVTPAYTRSLLARFPAQFTAESPQTDIASPLIEALSERELEVLQLVAAGLSNQEIAEELVLAVSTVKRHMSNVYGKLNVTSRTQAVACARELRLF